MRFCDKLQKLRKENNITQEGLADKLNVSRQAVSKWESGTGYPDTEKLIMLSKILNVSLDELVNDSEIKKNTQTEKLGFKEILDKVLEFISKSVDMFSSMKFKDKIKCLFEMAIIILIIFCVALITTDLISEIFRRIFMFLPSNLLYGIVNLVETLLYIIWIILGCIIVLKIFKSRYLDYYVFIKDDSVLEKVVEKPIPELKATKDVKVVIRDPKDSSLNIFSKIWNVCIWLFKCFCVFIVIPLIILFVFLMGLLVVSLFYITSGLLFNGISLALVGGLLFTYLLIEFLYNIISNQEHAFRRIFIIFIISISLVGLGFGLAVSDFTNYSVVKYDEYEKDTRIIEMEDNLVFDGIYNIDDNKIVIDDSINYIKLDILKLDTVEVNIYENTVWYSYDDDGYRYKYLDIWASYSELDFYKEVINNLKEKKIISCDELWKIDKIYVSTENLTKLRENYIKYHD